MCVFVNVCVHLSRVFENASSVLLLTVQLQINKYQVVKSTDVNFGIIQYYFQYVILPSGLY